MPSPFARHWALDPNVTFLNHGSFGACPRRVLSVQDGFRREMESEPVRFMVERLEPLLDESRAALAAFLGGRAEDYVFVPNATAAVNAVVRSMDLSPGDELLTVSHAYNACVNVLRYVGERTGAKVVAAEVERFPESAEAFVEAFMRHANERTRLVMVCHVTSPTAIVLPVERIVSLMRERFPRADVLVDGAHGPGMLGVDIERIGAAYYTANCHKWLCSPKGSAFLHVRKDRQAMVRPHVISHGANSGRKDRSRYLLEFDWTGTGDPTAVLCIPAAIRAMAEIWWEGDSGGTDVGPGGPPSVARGDVASAWSAIRARNRALALEGRRIVAASVGAELRVPDEMIGSIATIPLPDGVGTPPEPVASSYPDLLQRRLVERHRVQVPVSIFPKWPGRSIRVSAQLYNDRVDYERLAAALRRDAEGCSE